MSDEWTEERLTELRKTAQVVVDYVDYGGQIGVFLEATAALEDMLSAKSVLSLLDALEEARNERDRARLALAPMDRLYLAAKGELALDRAHTVSFIGRLTPEQLTAAHDALNS